MNKTIILIIVGLLLAIFGNICFAQLSAVPDPQIKQFDNGEYELQFLPGQLSGSENPSVKMRSVKLLGAWDELKLTRQTNDKYGYTTYKYQQYHHGLPVEGAQIIAHAKNGFMEYINGRVIPALDAPYTPTVTKETAKRNAQNEAYQLLNEKGINASISGDVVFFEGDPLLLYTIKSNTGYKASDYVLSYAVKVGIQDKKYSDERAIYIDAGNGSTIKNHSVMMDITGTCPTLFNGAQNIAIEWLGGLFNFYFLNDVSKYQLTLWFDNRFDQDPEFISSDYISFNEATFQIPGGTVHWAGGKVWDYYYSTFGRSGHDGLGNGLTLGTDYGDWNYAGYSSYYHRCLFGFCSAAPYIPGILLGSPSIVAHEWTHAIQDDEGCQGDEDTECGALSESFGDIFGEMTDVYVGSTCDYVVGAEVTVDGNGIRNMYAPNLLFHPDTYSGQYWDATGEVHINAGVQNYWFHLLAEGTDHSKESYHQNDNLNYYYVEGITNATAAAIAYYNMTTQLITSSTYSSACRGGTQSAAIIYGVLSNEALQTARAWYAVGVGDIVDRTLNASSVTSYDTYVGRTIDVNSYNISSTGKVLLFAGNAVHLNPGFHAYSGSQFRAAVNSIPGLNEAPANEDIVLSRSSTKNNVQESVELGNEKGESIETKLYPNSPNPFVASTAIRYALKNEGQVSVNIYNPLGQRVRTLVSGSKPSGYYSVTWEGRDDGGLSVSKGVYICRLTAGNYTKSFKMVLIK